MAMCMFSFACLPQAGGLSTYSRPNNKVGQVTVRYRRVSKLITDRKSTRTFVSRGGHATRQSARASRAGTTLLG